MREADYTGTAAKAWKVTAPPQRPDQTAALASWIVEGATIRMPMLDILGLSLVSRWLLAVVHLRPIVGQSRPATKHYARAEHEFIIVTLDPQAPAPDPDDDKTIIHMSGDFGLTPIPRVVQFDGVGDENAKLICWDAMRVICDGQIHPDLPQHVWEQTIIETVRHYRAGLHGEGNRHARH